MTALTSARPPGGRRRGLRPVPWRRMAGVTWRQHRFALAGVAVLLGALAVCLWIIGLSLNHAYAAAVACHPASSAACQGPGQHLGRHGQLSVDRGSPGGFILQVLPAPIGAFVGAPVLARELETGTFRYAWTQGFGRWRWALAKLVLLAVAVTAAAGAFGVLLSWYYQPYLPWATSPLALPRSPRSLALFGLRGVGFPAWTLAAFAIGALAGMLIRRVVPAIVATLVVYTGLAVATAGFLRVHYLTPLLTSSNERARTTRGSSASGGPGTAGSPSAAIPRATSSTSSALPRAGTGKGGKPPCRTCAQCLVQHGYAKWTSYQPASRFWPFQWIEGGWLLALSVLLIAATIWLVSRRAA